MPETHYSDRILVVDDADGSMTATRERMTECGFRHVTFATTGDEALRHLAADDDGSRTAESPFDLVILNLTLADMDGVELCATLRMNRKSENIPILILTDSTRSEDLQAAYMAGADDFVVAPIDNQRMMARVRTLLRLRRERARREIQERELRLNYQTLQRERLDSVLIDPVTRLARRVVVEMVLRSCEDHGDSAALAMLEVVDYRGYQERYGTEAAHKLALALGDMMLREEAPLGAMLCSYSDGVYMIVQQRATSAQRLQSFCTDIAQLVKEAELPHENSHFSRFVRLDFKTGWARGQALRELTGRMLLRPGVV